MTISLCGLSAVRSGRTILHPTSFNIKPGERIGLVGASGSGKSTLGHALIDTLRQQGHNISHVPQSPDEALDPLRSMGFHWREAVHALGLAQDAEQQQALFRALKIDHGDLCKRPWGWSRGMQQRFVIGMAMIGQPALLVMDEPTSALDPIVAAQSMALLSDHLSGSDTALMLITHDLGLAAQHVSRILVMDDGQIVEDSPANTLLSSPQTLTAKSLCAHRNWLALPC